jgi:hypothetical protein
VDLEVRPVCRAVEALTVCLDIHQPGGSILGDAASEPRQQAQAALDADVYAVLLGAILGVSVPEGGSEGHPVARRSHRRPGPPGRPAVHHEGPRPRRARGDSGAQSRRPGPDDEDIPGVRERVRG